MGAGTTDSTLSADEAACVTGVPLKPAHRISTRACSPPP